MNVFALFAARVADALQALYPSITEEALSRIVVEPPRDAAHGDLSTNAAMVVAKPLGKNPREVATALAEHFKADAEVISVEVAGPGFINFRLATPVWHAVLKSIAAQGGDFGKTDIGGGERVNVEYVSANPTGPMHVGHTRGAVFGDALASLMAYVGYDVTREYYINDAGSQIDTLAKSTMLRYREALGESIDIPAGFYPGDYLIPVGEALKAEFGDALLHKPEPEALALVRDKVLAAMMDLIRADLAQLNIHHDVFFSERQLHGQGGDIDTTLDWLRSEDMIYQGRLEPPKGKTPDDWEDREQTLFRSTDFGDDVDRALMKSDGSYTYFAGDMAYHHNKLSRGYRHLINVFGADHTGYIKRMQATVAALSGGKADLDIKVCQLVRLLRGGEPVKMSKRAGTFVTLREVVDEVGSDPIRFMMLYRKNDAALDFDLAKVVEKSKDNPVFYVQYAHARAYSIFRNAAEAFAGLGPRDRDVTGADTSLLTDEGELDLLRRLALFPRIAEGAARAHEPHRIAFYLSDLASAFHAQWTRGNDSPHLRFIQANDRNLTAVRLALVGACAQVIATGLAILGVHAPIEMR